MRGIEQRQETDNSYENIRCKLFSGSELIKSKSKGFHIQVLASFLSKGQLYMNMQVLVFLKTCIFENIVCYVAIAMIQQCVSGGRDAGMRA